MTVMPSERIKTITTLDSPQTMVASGHGNISYRVWCEKEKARLNQKGDDVYVHEFVEWGQIALVRRKGEVKV